MVATGMKAAGYRVILLDEGWWLGTRDAAGNITVEKEQWPAIEPGETAGDMSNIVRYIHKLGLKAGIYTDAGADGCSTWWPDTGPQRPHTGSLGHYRQDFTQFARWGFDYVKVDWCGGDKPNLDPAVQYAEIAQAMGDAERETGHHLFYSICNWGRQKPWTWGPGIGGSVADMWRTGGDIVEPIVADNDPKHAKRLVTVENVYGNFEVGLHPEAQHTGYYNDLDMLVLGMRGTDQVLDRLHMSLWAISGAPLIVGADLTKLTSEQTAALTDPEVLAIDQDRLGLQGYRLQSSKPGLEVYAKPLATPGERAVLLLNRTKTAANISFDLTDLGLRSGSSAKIRDAWAKKDLGSVANEFSASVMPNTGMLLRISGTDAPKRTYNAESVSPSHEHPCASCSAETANRRYTIFQHVAGSGDFAPIWITFAEPGDHPAMVQMQVNQDPPTTIQVPARSATEPRVVVLANLPKGSENQIRFWRSDGHPASVKELQIGAAGVE